MTTASRVGRIERVREPGERALAEVEEHARRHRSRSRYEAPVAPGRSVYAGPAPITSRCIAAIRFPRTWGRAACPAGARSDPDGSGAWDRHAQEGSRRCRDRGRLCREPRSSQVSGWHRARHRRQVRRRDPPPGAPACRRSVRSGPLAQSPDMPVARKAAAVTDDRVVQLLEDHRARREGVADRVLRRGWHVVDEAPSGPRRAGSGRISIAAVAAGSPALPATASVRMTE